MAHGPSKLLLSGRPVPVVRRQDVSERRMGFRQALVQFERFPGRRSGFGICFLRVEAPEGHLACEQGVAVSQAHVRQGEAGGAGHCPLEELNGFLQAHVVATIPQIPAL